MSTPSVHDDWLSLIEISGPFLAVPVLKEAFPQGLEELDATKRKRLRQAYEEWREALELEDAQFAELHVAWIDEVLSRGLELNEDGKGDVLKRADWCAANLQASLPEHGVTLSSDFAVIDEQRANKPMLLIQAYAQDIDLDATLKQDGWVATPADRMVQLCRSLGCRLGLVTNGERWMLVDAPVGAVSTFASWYARIWSQEPITLQAFVHLLGIRRFFVDESEQLPALFDRSLKFQDEVTEALGEQVRRAVEVLIQTLDKADQDRNRELLRDVKEPELYEAALTVMMRLVFLLSAEERGLLLMGDERYEANYALSTLRMQLRKESEEILERRWDAWSRLLAIFRAVFGGIEHENLRLPALGGSLFDPDRFPFLEGRAKGSSWRTDAAKPLPIDNRTVLLLLEAIQQFQGRTLSYRALDVEQIGYVYEGLLERTVKRTNEVTLELDATKSAKTPWVKLAELDSAHLDGAARLIELLQERSGSSASRVRNDLAKPVDDTLADRLLTACQGDVKLRDRVKLYAHLLRTDPWGYPLIYPSGAFIVTTGSDRRETGTHYTPKSLTEAIVIETLTPVAYVGPAEGKPREQWVLKSPDELLDLKICDPAMGSGAFLVQACRWLADRLVESWSQVEALGKTVSVDGEVLEAGAAKEPLPRDSEARTVIARRLIAERCLYGVDLNPLAVELAKLSIWLVTLAKGRPFGFLDHNLRCGNSLLGIHRLDQLTELSMSPGRQRQQRLFGRNIEQAVREAMALRMQLREMPIRDINDVMAMAHLNDNARQILQVSERIADALIGEAFHSGGNERSLEAGIAMLSMDVELALEGDAGALTKINNRTRNILVPAGTRESESASRLPFHWPLEFPEVFTAKVPGFHATLGNPPWGAGLSEADIEYLKWIYPSSAYKLINSFKFFIERMEQITVRRVGYFSFLVPSSLLEHIGCRDTRQLLLSRTPSLFIDCGDGMFSGVTQSCCFGLVGQQDAIDAHPVLLSLFTEYSKSHHLNATKKTEYKTILEIKGRKNFVLNHGATSSAFDNENFIPLSRLSDVFDSGIDYSRAALGNAVFYTGVSAENPADHRVLRGRNIDRFFLKFDGIWLRHDWRSIQQEQIKEDPKSRLKVNEKAYLISPKILVRQTGDSIIATVDSDRHYHQKSLLSVLPKDGISAYLLCAILNHPETTKIYQGMTMQSGKVFSQVKKNFLEQIPMLWSFNDEVKNDIANLSERLINSSDPQERIELKSEIEDAVSAAFQASL